MAFNRNDDGFQRRSLIEILFAPFRAVRDWVGDAISGDDGIRDRDGFNIVKLLTLPFRLLWGFFVFMVQAWTTSRNGIAFLRGLPAFGILIFTPFLLWVFSNYERQISLGPTLGYHTMHSRNKAWDEAQMFALKLVELRPEDKQYKFMLAENLDRLGDNGEATRIMRYLAGSTDIGSDDIPGETGTPLNEADGGGVETPTRLTEDEDADRAPEKFAEAHVWLSQQLIRKQRVEGYDESRNQLAMDHLRAAIDVDPENIRAKVSLVDLYMTRAKALDPEKERRPDMDPETQKRKFEQNLRLARESLVSLTAFQNFSRMEQVLAMPQLIDVCQRLGDEQGARRALTDASTKVVRIARLNPDIYEIWFSLVQCAVTLQDYERANEFIRTGYQNVKTPETRQKMMQLASLVYIKNADDFIDISTEDSYRNRLFALCKAIGTNPRDVRIYDRLVDYIDVGLDEEKHDVWLRNSILDCPIPGVVHILIGVRELLRGDVVAGKTSWDIAQHQFGTTEFVIHRLLSVSIKKRPDFGEGDLLDTALLLFPDQYMLYETRGAIKKNSMQYEDAVKDFEIVIEKVPDLITVHKHLKDCYEQLGNTSKSLIHAKRVEELLAKVDEKQRELYQRVLNDL
jgi:tetratricopeptide (TPR) repeat protein